MAEFSEKYSKIIKDIEKSISDEKEREIVLKKVSEKCYFFVKRYCQIQKNKVK